MAPFKRQRDWSTPQNSFKRTRILPPSFTATSYRGRTSTQSRSGQTFFRKKGPYLTLTSGQRHTNPVYPKPELKIYDCDQTGVSPPSAAAASAITNAGTVVCLNKLVTGTGVQNFLGNQVSIKQASYRFELDLPALPANQVPTSGRVLLIWDKQPNGVTAAFTDIFASASYLAFGNVNTRERFVILRNDQFSLSPNGDQTLFFERYLPINMLTTFVSGQAVAGVPQTGALLLAFVGDQSVVANQPTLIGWFRVRYYDN